MKSAVQKNILRNKLCKTVLNFWARGDDKSNNRINADKSFFYGLNLPNERRVEMTRTTAKTNIPSILVTASSTLNVISESSS